MNPNLDPYVSVVPRLIPSQYSSKRIPMSDEGYQYGDTHPMSSYMSPQGNPNNRMDLNQPQDNMSYPNQSLYDNSFKGRTNKNRIHHEALKDNSYDQYPYPNNSDYKSFDNLKEKESENSLNQSTKTLIIIFGMIIALFSITALAISIYLLIRISNSTTTSG